MMLLPSMVRLRGDGRRCRRIPWPRVRMERQEARRVGSVRFGSCSESADDLTENPQRAAERVRRRA